MENKIEGLNFQPWESEAYSNGNGIYGKLLICGESHYMKAEEEDGNGELSPDILEVEKDISSNKLTSVIVSRYINHELDSLKFYKNLGLLFNKDNPYEVWQNVAFANLIQVTFDNPDQRPSAEDIETVSPAFSRLIEYLKPEKIIVCSLRMWETWLKDYDEKGKCINTIKHEKRQSNVWQYNHPGGKSIAIGIMHPSNRHYKREEWDPILIEFLKMKV